LPAHSTLRAPFRWSIMGVGTPAKLNPLGSSEEVALSLVDSLGAWTESARKLATVAEREGHPQDATYFPISASCLGRVFEAPLWEDDDIDEAFERPSNTFNALRSYLAIHPTDPAIRWTVLALLYDLSQEPEDDETD